MDFDEDGFGDAANSAQTCQVPVEYVTNDSDCNDNDDLINPDAEEICDTIDNNCDTLIDTDDNGNSLLGLDEGCPAENCVEILNEGWTTDWTYYITDKSGEAIPAYCEMDFLDGGWLAVFNHKYQGDSTTDAANFHNAIIQNDDMTSPVLPSDTSAAIHTSNVDLSNYTEVVYGWAPAETDDVTRYGLHTDNSGLSGKCYVDGYCGAGVTIGDFEIQPTGNIRSIQTGNSPGYPHVGMGFSGQIIVWGYDRDYSSYGNWANWYDGNPCCNSGNSSDISGNTDWRYVVYIR